ncbi:ATP-grasp fold amidoligase family protein [Bacillus pacificus]
MIDYVDNHDNGKLGFYDTEFNQLPYRRLDFGEIKEKLNKPKNFDEMLKIASKLSEDFPHVRVDLYNIDGEILFGELTFL